MERREVEQFPLRNGSDLCKLVEELGYKDNGNHFPQLQLNNRAHVSSLLNFFDDNPGALEKVQEFIMDSKFLVSDDSEEEEEVEEEEPPTVRPGES